MICRFLGFLKNKIDPNTTCKKPVSIVEKRLKTNTVSLKIGYVTKIIKGKTIANVLMYLIVFIPINF